MHRQSAALMLTGQKFLKGFTWGAGNLSVPLSWVKFEDSTSFFLYNSTNGQVLELYKDAGKINPGRTARRFQPNGERQNIKYFQVDLSDSL
jgi:hypothetical protein